jgi:hypothetical protein
LSCKDNESIQGDLRYAQDELFIFMQKDLKADLVNKV